MKSLFALAVVAAAAAAVAPAAQAADSVFNYSLTDAGGRSFVGTISVDLAIPDVDAITGFTLAISGCGGIGFDFCSSTFTSDGVDGFASWAYQGPGTQPGTWVVANDLTFNLGDGRRIYFNGNDGDFTPEVSFFKDGVLIANAQLLNTTPGTRASDGDTGFVFATLAPVPEPETYALMLAGLAAMGAVVKRRTAAQ